MVYSNEEKVRRLEEWRQSGKNAWAYAKENGIKPRTFAKWTQAGRDGKGNFVEIPQAQIKSQLHMREIVIEKGDVKVHLPFDLSSAELRIVMEGIGIAL